MKRKVLEVIRQGQIGGGESHLADLIELMDKTHFEPVCLSFTPGEMINRLEALGIRCHVINSQRGFDLGVQKAVSTLFRDEQIALVHAHGTRAASNILFPTMRQKLPLVYTVHGWSFHDDQSWPVYQARKWSEKLICSRADRVICVSDGNAQTGREAFGLKTPIVIKNGVNLQRFSPSPSVSNPCPLPGPESVSNPNIRVKSVSIPCPLRGQESVTNPCPLRGFKDDDFIVGFIARCTKQKAPLDFLAAVALAHQTDPSIKALFVGEGDMDAEVDRYISDHQMQDYICRTPFRTDVPDLLRLMDVFCLPSLWEGLSIGLLEAMAMGCAIIATPTDGTREVIKNEENGLIVPFSSPSNIADAIVRLKADATLRTRCGQNARQLVAGRFNAQRVADAVVTIYEEVCGQTR